MFASRSQAGTRLGAVLFLVLSTAACSSTNDSSSIATARASAASASAAAASASAAGEPTTGLTQVEVAGEGFSIGIPEGWTELSAADLEEAGGFGEVGSANPGVANALSQAQAAIESGQLAFSRPTRNPRTRLPRLSQGSTSSMEALRGSSRRMRRSKWPRVCALRYP